MTGLMNVGSDTTREPMATMRPRRFHHFVTEFCEMLVSGSIPLVVSKRPESNSAVKECFFNVRAKAERSGGAIVYGWAIWELPGIFLEGQFHAVWRATTGELVDVSPDEDGEIAVVFVPGPAASYDFNRFVALENRRMPILQHPLVDKLLQHLVDEFQFWEAGRNPSDPRTQTVDAAQAEWFKRRQLEIEMEIAAIPSRPNDICRCGSGAKFKRCCGN